MKQNQNQIHVPALRNGEREKSGGRQLPVKQVVCKPHKPFLLTLKGEQEGLYLAQQPDPSGSSLPGGQESSWNWLKSCSWFWRESERWREICIGWSWRQGGRPADFIWCRCSWEVSESRSCIVYQEEGALSGEVLVQTSSLPPSPPQGC